MRSVPLGRVRGGGGSGFCRARAMAAPSARSVSARAMRRRAAALAAASSRKGAWAATRSAALSSTSGSPRLRSSLASASITRAGGPASPVTASRTRPSFSAERVAVAATATTGGSEGSAATRSSAAPCGAPGIITARSTPPPDRSRAGQARNRSAGLSRGSSGWATRKTALSTSSAATSSESGSAATASPPSVAMPRSSREGSAAQHASGSRPAECAWTAAAA